MNRKKVIALVGLGYVGLPIALAFSGKRSVIAFDINQKRIAELRKGMDATGEVSAEELGSTQMFFTDNPDDLSQATFFIVTVPTPIDDAKRPDFQPLFMATETIGRYLKKNDIVVYESTVYPGATEEECMPILEKISGLKSGTDFFVGYSPERINPGDKEHGFINNTKIVSAQNSESLEIIASEYQAVIEANVYRAESIRVAEAAKVIENTQRDLNIAFMNELAVICHKLNIDTQTVLDAAGTKWNFLPFRPGLVGGHCIGVDPYYLTHKAESIGYHPEVILAGRRINDNMGKYIAEQAVKQLIQSGENVKAARVGILGFTFKENCPDIRNTQVRTILRELQEYGIKVLVHDPLADISDVRRAYDLELSPLSDFIQLNLLVLAVAHKEYRELLPEELFNMLSVRGRIIFDIKSILDKKLCEDAGIRLWRL